MAQDDLTPNHANTQHHHYTHTREKLWEPSRERVENSRMFDFQQWLAHNKGVTTTGYRELHDWSTTHVDDFWEFIWEYFPILGQRGNGPVRTGDSIETTRWFPGATINYAQSALRWASEQPDQEALVSVHESEPRESLTWRELEGKVGALAQGLREMGVKPGDRVCAVLPNIGETVIALLASATVGAIWSVVNTDFGDQGVADRFAQIEPKILITVDGYGFNGEYRDMLPYLSATAAVLPTIEHHILIDRHVGPADKTPELSVPTHRFSTLTQEPRTPEYEATEFSHPLWILYSSGTTGKPKGIMHGHGGIVLDAHKVGALHSNLSEKDRMYFAVATTWMVWNLLVNVLQVGCTAITYDGSPAYDTPGKTFEIVADEGATHLGTGAALLTLAEKAGITPADRYNLSRLRTVMSTGSTLPESTWRWVYAHVSEDVMLSSSSGGTDICSGIIGGNPFDAVYLNELQAPYLGVAAAAFNDKGERIVGTVGELVFTQPIPNMPVSFWDDPDGAKYHAAYFNVFPGVWRHGDWATELENGSWIIHGRSDSTINRGGIRMGSADICEVVNQVPGVQVSMVIGAEMGDGAYYMPLFVVPTPGTEVDDKLQAAITNAIRTKISPRYVPDEIIPAPAVPRTRTGKLMEVPIKKVIQGADGSSVNRTAAEDPAVIDWYVDFAQQHRERE